MQTSLLKFKISRWITSTVKFSRRHSKFFPEGMREVRQALKTQINIRCPRAFYVWF